ncbi:MAG: ABC transporter permease [Bacteroidales bacterium]|nr:ABC transporter permease [Bacteroidales bacterium]MDY5894147.1 ABC transporter permease [Candidatus Limisoma sp.]MDD7603890.1 ABC transporter permease [Bacteroidales bacterium]MDD7760745.1 ABC transporter permease [Bacteroidales bacterium]MDY6000147.1 ABC transporter permease [Candidatus Limisoma sp.]
MKGLLWKLLKKHVSKSQMFGFALANIIGLTIVLLGVQFYQDVRNIFADEDSFMRKDYLVVTKRVGELNAIATMMGGGANTFTDNELTQLRNEPWVRDVGEFSTSNYQVYGTISLAGQSVSLRSSFFFEAVPDKFLDVKSKDWHFDPEHPQIPIIVSKDYLSLYNFGFAASQGMPQMSENMIGMVPIVFRLTGNNGTQDYLEGRIVGFSNRLNTIIVPQSFMDWSNKRYAPNADSQASRIIVEVSNPGDPAVESYMNSHGYEIAGDKLNSSKANRLLTIILSIVVAIGLVICVLSFFILILSIFLLLQKNTQKLQNLLLLGYSPRQVSGMYVRMIVYINIAVYVLSIAAMLVARTYYLPLVQAFGAHNAGIEVAAAVGAALIAVITLGNVTAVRRKVRNLWLLEK